MFLDESMYGYAHEVNLNNREATRVSLMDVVFTEDAMLRIGLGIKKISSMTGLPEGIIKSHMKWNLFKVPPSENLYFLFTVPEIDADMHITIPPKYFNLINS